MKTIKIICLVALFAIITNVASANSAAFAAAKKSLNETIYKTIKSDFKKVDNFLYENEINKLNNVVKLILKCENCDATEYIKDLFRKYNIKADPVLAGKYFQVSVRLIYKAI